MKDIFDDLESAVPAEFVKFDEEGQTELGVVVALTEDTGEHGNFIRAELERRDGSHVLINGFGAVLAGVFEKLYVGDGIKITYQGKKPTKNGKYQYHSYGTVVRPGPGHPALPVPKAAPVAATNGDAWAAVEAADEPVDAHNPTGRAPY